MHDGLVEQLVAAGPELVLVDYFDTLVTRRIDAKTLKRVVARHLAERFELAGNANAVIEARRRAEREGRQAAVACGSDEEHRIDDMATRMWEILFTDAGIDTGSPDCNTFVEVFLEIELSVEVAAQDVDLAMVEVLRSLGCPVVVVSDYHFTQPLFTEMLRRKGLESLIVGPPERQELAGASLDESVFVSGSVGLSKASGRLYGHVQEALEGSGRWPSSSSVVMVGDNNTSDVVNAKAAGLHAVRVVRVATADAPSTTLPDRGRRQVQRVATERAAPLVERHRIRKALGADTEGPTPFIEMAATLFAFTRLLAQECIEEESTPSFLAREGLILKELFDHFVATSPISSGRVPCSSYLVVSRRSTVLAGLRGLEEENFQTLLSKYPAMTMLDLLGSLGLEPSMIQGASVETVFDAPVDLAVLRAHRGFANAYEVERLAQHELLEEYVSSITGRDDGPLHVVDVGWKGTIQDHLQAALPHRTLRGSYLGIVEPDGSSGVVDGATKRGHLFDSRTSASRSYRILRHFKSLYEFLLTAEHGSAARYEQQDGETTIEPVLDDQPAEAAIFGELIAPIQADLRRGFEALCRLDLLSEAPILATLDDVADVHQRMLFFPTGKEIELIASMRHYENFGSIGMIDVGRGRTVSLLGRLRSLRDVARRPGRVLGSGWPPLTLWSAGLGGLVRPLGVYRRVHERRPKSDT